MAAEIDWKTFGKVRPLTIDDLRRYSAADLDPYTVQVGQVLCEQFVFSQQGHRNLAGAFDSLPIQSYDLEDFEIGYGAYHVIPIILRTDTGYTLAALVGLLAEYFSEEFVVQVLMLLARRAKIPMAFAPLEHQWRRMVDIFYGVLSTSSFGQLLCTLEDTLPCISGELDAGNILDALTSMNQVVRSKGSTDQLPAGAELVWSAAVASWLYGLQFNIQTSFSQVLHAYPDTSGKTQAQLVFTVPQDASYNSKVSPSPDRKTITGGRVMFQRFFRSCFGEASTVLKEEALAAYICCAGNLLHQDALKQTQFGPQTIFLTKAYDTSGNAGGGGLTASMAAWFPELNQLSKHFTKYKKVADDKLLSTFDEAVHQLKHQCQCTACSPETAPLHPYCKLTLAQLILLLGLYTRPMVVSPRLYPKRNGVLSFYKHLVLNYPPQSTTASTFTTSVADVIPTSALLLQVGVLLFGNSHAFEVDSLINLMGITSTGLTVFVTNFKEDDEGVLVRDRKHFSVMVSPGWLCLLGHEARLEIYDPAYIGWDFYRQWEAKLAEGEEMVQIFKWKDRIILSSIVLGGGEDERRAIADGWTLNPQKSNEKRIRLIKR